MRHFLNFMKTMFFLKRNIIISSLFLALNSSYSNNNEQQILIDKNSIIENIKITKAWMRMPTPGARNTAAYFTIKNNNNFDIKIVSADSGDISKKTEIHGYKKDDNDIKRMYQLNSVTIPSGQDVSFKEGSFHVMILDVIHDKISLNQTYPIKFNIMLSQNIFDKSSNNNQEIGLEYQISFPTHKSNPYKSKNSF